MKETNDPRSKRASSDDTAEVGIGTMIVFIAAVIVAAIAAAVLVNTAGNLQRTAQETGDETTQEVSGNIFVRDITGHVTSDTNEDKINSTNFTVALAPGADSIDLETMTIQWQDNGTLEDLDFNGHAANSGTHKDCESFSDGFCVLNVVEEEGTGDNVLEPGDLVHLHIGLDETGEDEPLETRMEVDVKLMPESGAPVVTGFTTPDSYDGQTYVALK